jgi:hypothetical protein
LAPPLLSWCSPCVAAGVASLWLRVQGVSGGSPTFIQTTYKFDGKPYPEYTQTSLAEFAATGATPNANIYWLVDLYTVEIDRLDASGKGDGHEQAIHVARRQDIDSDVSHEARAGLGQTVATS